MPIRAWIAHHGSTFATRGQHTDPRRGSKGVRFVFDAFSRVGPLTGPFLAASGLTVKRRRLVARTFPIPLPLGNLPRHLPLSSPDLLLPSVPGLLAPNVSCCAKVWFQPKLIRAVHDTCVHNVLKCDVDISKFSVRLCRVVSLTTMFQGTGGHMTNDLMSLAPSTMKVQVAAPPE